MSQSGTPNLADLDLLTAGQPIDLSNCDKEPIHVPGAIQPHGALLALSWPSFEVVQLSANVEQMLGVKPGELLGRPLSGLLGEEQMARLSRVLERDDFEANPLFVFPLQIAESSFDAVVHRLAELAVLELEPSGPQATQIDFYTLKATIQRLERTRSLQDFYNLAAGKVQEVSGFDRVMIYRFSPEDGSGSVVAEVRRQDLEPFLGLHYPASDIPKQARVLYVLNHIRLIADANYTPVRMLALEADAPPLDMSHCFLRSVSPIHLEYLRNMGVAASMSISIIKDGQLWGLVACHHYSPRLLSYEVRTACEFLGQVMSLQIQAKEDLEHSDYRTRLGAMSTRFLELLSRSDDLAEGLVRHDLNLLDYIKGTGAAVCMGGEFVLLGETPNTQELRELVAWLAGNRSEVFATKALSKEFAHAARYADVASGLLAVRLSRQGDDFVMWFRPEVLQTVSWGGDPNKPVETAGDGSKRLSPRKSFALWKQTVEQCAEAWLEVEIEAARELRRVILEVVLRRAQQLQNLNQELRRSNADLDAFAYVASHDLKEPLRGIHNYASFLLEDYQDKLESEGQEKLRTLMKLTRRMESLIESLLSFSRIGRSKLALQEINLSAVLTEVLELLNSRLGESSIQVRIPRKLPTAIADQTQLEEVWVNLISNAAKYNDKPQRWIEIGHIATHERQGLGVPEGVPEAATIYYVQDNGIGIRGRHHQDIFRIFKRLHGREEFGGGTGAGLTITKKIIERHGGQIWLESTVGEGSRFFFTLEGG